MAPMLTIGLTGGIASGKSLVAQKFVELGASLVDTDVIAREVVAPGEPGLTAIRKVFGPGMLTESGDLDRAAMRDLVFHDAAKRQALETLLHPRIRSRMLEHIAAATGPYTIVAVPLLVESGFAQLFDRVLVVDCPEAIQIARLTARDGIQESDADAMLAAQTSRATRLAAADDVVDNSGALEATYSQVEALHRRYLELAQGSAAAT
jgi:dephospho-CoA kinase